jgi:hydrogenase/urease accessory protein HupE
MVSVRRQLFILAAVLIGFAGFCTVSYGHALQPGYLELRLVDKDLYSVLWKKPAVSGKPMTISARLPIHCDQRIPPPVVRDGNAYLARWTARCAGGLEGGEIRIDGLEQTSTDVLVRFDFSDGGSESRRLTPEESSFMIPAVPSHFDVVRTYLQLGFKHILEGIDHLMFVLALLIMVNGARRLVITVSAFTLAHSLTLVGATLGLVRIPGPPVEAAIALSIMFVASEIMHSRSENQGLTEKYPWVVAFIFGLLHGLGFAGALAQIGLPQSAIPLALLFFNVGVEFGQLFFIACVFSIIALGRVITRRIRMEQPAWISNVPPYIIGSAAAFWTIQRLVNF